MSKFVFIGMVMAQLVILCITFAAGYQTRGQEMFGDFVLVWLLLGVYLTIESAIGDTKDRIH